MRVVTGTQMKQIDMAAIEGLGIKGKDLMERAGHGVYEEAMTALGGSSEPLVVIVCGAGNNGGDGYVAARYLNRAGVKTCIYTTVDMEDLKGDIRENYLDCIGLPIKIMSLHKGIDLDEGLAAFMSLSDDLGKGTVIVDAILGTGVNRQVGGIIKLTIDMINRCGKTVIAVDIPSGIGADDGRVYGCAVKADTTVTFQAPKLGCVIYPGAEFTGKLVIKDIGIPESLVLSMSDDIALIEQSTVSSLIKKRDKTFHKGDFGKVLIIAGSKGMAGAAALCARAALRTGAGLVRVAVTPEILYIIQVLVPEATCIMREQAAEVFEDYDAIVIGPGLSIEADSRALLMKIIAEYNGILIIDADGLNAIEDLALLRQSKSSLILTPHPGEAGKLLGCSTAQINADRLNSAKQLADISGACIVLKGAASLVTFPDGKIFINTTGNPGMATAGSGDVLSGIIAALAAQGIPWEHAAQTGVYLHGQAGDIMAEQIGEYGLVASDLTIGIAHAIYEIIKNQ